MLQVYGGHWIGFKFVEKGGLGFSYQVGNLEMTEQGTRNGLGRLDDLLIFTLWNYQTAAGTEPGKNVKAGKDLTHN